MPDNAETLAAALGMNPETHLWAYILWDDRGCFVCPKCTSDYDIECATQKLALPDPCVDTPEARRAWLAEMEQEKHGFLVASRYSLDNWDVTFRGKNAARFTGEDSSRYLASLRAFCAAHGVELNWETEHA